MERREVWREGVVCEVPVHKYVVRVLMYSVQAPLTMQ